ncbi:MAG: endonuclease/exonuclease/phosphatase family protein [Bdellovibrionales bacterium]|nr:endonuclease/exonuclease/phosphatase family protein [Bdellovibrionales bacterium]
MHFLLSLLLFQASYSFAAETTHIRVMTSNLTTGNHQNYDNGEGIRIMKGLKADVILVQEFNYKSDSEKDIKDMVAQIGPEFSYYRESEDSDKIPNGIISRFPILQSGEWADENNPDRDFAWAKLDVPGAKKLWAISVHLKSSTGAANAARRMAQTKALKRYIADNIPESDYVVLGGDFNVVRRDDAIIKEFADVLYEDGTPTDSDGASVTNMSRKNNYDWILNDKDIAGYQVPVRFKTLVDEADIELQNTYSKGLVFDSTNFPVLDRVEPVQKEDSRANGMQHLTVVKDYEIPASEVTTDTDEDIDSCVWYQWGCW